MIGVPSPTLGMRQTTGRRGVVLQLGLPGSVRSEGTLHLHRAGSLQMERLLRTSQDKAIVPLVEAMKSFHQLLGQCLL